MGSKVVVFLWGGLERLGVFLLILIWLLFWLFLFIMYFVDLIYIIGLNKEEIKEWGIDGEGLRNKE